MWAGSSTSCVFSLFLSVDFKYLKNIYKENLNLKKIRDYLKEPPLPPPNMRVFEMCLPKFYTETHVDWPYLSNRFIDSISQGRRDVESARLLSLDRQRFLRPQYIAENTTHPRFFEE
jgi:hypothetical protein